MRNVGRVPVLLTAMAMLILGACTSQPPAGQAQKSTVVPETIQGKVQIQIGAMGSADAGLSQGSPVVFLWQGVRRYTLFFRNPVAVEPAKEYVVEGINAQKVIDDLGDPDQGANGYPLAASCERVVRMAWGSLAFDEVDAHSSALRVRVKRYPARPVFLVMKIEPAADQHPGTEADRENARVVSVAAGKQRASLIAGTTELTAPLWEPAGGTVRCEVVINTEGKIAELGTGMQLCEAVPWSDFRYRPLVQAGFPVKVKTEVEVCFKPRIPSM